MTDINKKAREYRGKEYQERIVRGRSFFDSVDIEFAFKSGANYALHYTRWRKVDEELPEGGEVVLVKTIQSSDQKCFLYDIAIYHTIDKEFYSRASVASSIYEVCYYVIEWKPIDSL